MKNTLRLIIILFFFIVLGNLAVSSSISAKDNPLLEEAETSPFYIIEAAYPYWRMTTYPTEYIPLDLVTQISHVFILPGQDGALAVPPGFIMPALIDRVHAANREITLGVGGASSYDEFVSMLADPQDRSAFVQNLTSFVLQHGYDGVEIDWEFPKNGTDRTNLNVLIQELRDSLQATGQGIRLTLVVSANDWLGQWIDVGTITPLVDNYLVMTFAYHSATSSYSGHNTPMYPPSFEPDEMGVAGSIAYWVDERGVPRRRILLGLATFGISYDSESLYSAFQHFEQDNYSAIQPLVGAGYTRNWDTTSLVPYLTQDSGPWLWSYDDPQSIGIKCEFVIDNNLAGVAIWDVTGDRIGNRQELIEVAADRLMRYPNFMPCVFKP